MQSPQGYKMAFSEGGAFQQKLVWGRIQWGGNKTLTAARHTKGDAADRASLEVNSC